MIQANELRIGNIVFVLDKISTICGVLRSGVYFGEHGFCANLCDWIKPILLTDEILRDWCGFERLEQNDSVLRIGGEDNLSGFELFGNERFGYKLAEYSDSADYFGAWNQITSLHQLQNLYHALTGEELPISTPKTV